MAMLKSSGLVKLSGLALAAVLGAGLMSGPASAMPATGLASAANQAVTTRAVTNNGVQDVRYVCGPYRCWWRPGGYYYGPRYYNHYVGPRHYWYWHRRYW